MVSGVKKDTGSFVYMRLMKHDCPECGNRMKVVKLKKTVRSKTKDAKNFDFTACDLSLGDKVKFIWYEFKCRECDKTYTEDSLRAIEKQKKKEQKAALKAERKAEKLAEKQAEKEAKKAEKAEDKKAEEATE